MTMSQSDKAARSARCTRPTRVRDRQPVGRRLRAHPRRPRLPGARDLQRRLRRRTRQRDGKVTRDEALAHARVIVEATDLPVSADLEKGFGDAPAVAAETIRLAAGDGARRRLDRGRHRRQGPTALRLRPGDGARGAAAEAAARCRFRSR